jgi:tRNA G10  N-methylase Trm11
MNKYGLRIDLRKEVKPHIIADAHSIPLDGEQFDVILADPPYSTQEAKELYGTPKLNYKTWTKEADRLLKPFGLLIVYHKYIMPNPMPGKYSVIKRVFIGNRIYHLPRAAIFFQKQATNHQSLITNHQGLINART